MVGAEYNTQHGLTNAIILPVVMNFNLPHVGEKVKYISQAMDLKEASSSIILEDICKILDYVQIPRSLSEIGVPLECKRRIAEKAMLDSATGTNPRVAQVEDIEKSMNLRLLKIQDLKSRSSQWQRDYSLARGDKRREKALGYSQMYRDKAQKLNDLNADGHLVIARLRSEEEDLKKMQQPGG